MTPARWAASVLALLALAGALGAGGWSLLNRAPEVAPGAEEVPLQIEGASDVLIEDMDFVAADATSPGSSSIAARAVDATEVTAGRIVERAKDVFRETEGVSQTRAGRIRLVAEGVFSVLSERTTLKASDDLALMAEKIELG